MKKENCLNGGLFIAYVLFSCIVLLLLCVFLCKMCIRDSLWNGQPLEHKLRLKRSYMVMQDVNYELFAESVEAECSFGIRNPDQDLVETTMAELGLTTYRERHPNTLSGGQKQRVAVAVSMICGKDLLVFDEPTSGLDFDSMAQVAGLILSLIHIFRISYRHSSQTPHQ